jgi:hypothetical protein
MCFGNPTRLLTRIRIRIPTPALARNCNRTKRCWFETTDGAMTRLRDGYDGRQCAPQKRLTKFQDRFQAVATAIRPIDFVVEAFVSNAWARLWRETIGERVVVESNVLA